MTKQDRNDTAHQRAMANPDVQKAFRALQSNWNKLSLLQKGEQLKKLSDFGCSVRALALELGEKESTFRRYISKANSKADRCATRSQPKEPSEAVLQVPPKISAKQEEVHAIKVQHPALDHAQPLMAQQKTKIISSSPTTAKEPSVVNQTKEQQDLSDLANRVQRLDTLQSEPMKQRKVYTARSMKRPGRPLPPQEDI